MTYPPSWPGFVPAIHAFGKEKQDVDARDKRGHDELQATAIEYKTPNVRVLFAQ
jgi:hypothetical protein